jgi:PKD repeat protein
VNRGGSGTGTRAPQSRAWAAGVLLVAVLAIAASLSAAQPFARAGSPAVLGLSLTAVPVGGDAPLVVELRATIDPSAESGSFEWNFGDGVTYGETATGYSEVSHDYPRAGNFTASVFVQSSLGDSNASVALTVTATPLSAAIVASPTTGVAPLTVQFGVEPTGGSGTYTSFVWSFGDGGQGSGTALSYTYTRAGTFDASVLLTDTSGQNATASIEIDVVPAAGAAGPSSSTSTPSALAFVLPAVAVLAVAALAAALYLRSVVRRGAAPTETTPPAAGAARSPEAAPASESPTGPPSPEEMVQAAASRPASEDSRSLSELILVHLYWYGRSNIDGVARADASQAGMARRLGVAQNSLSKALRRLVDAGALKVELEHVPGAPRRLKTYALTPRGESVARRIRTESERRPRP